ncbi:hypothetical protein M9Y10_016064 [Tritrichomonas musculus]|uniref:Uncharacterized protein n=1 Tax=Tritrichomonas musculus TaxID=1915356 RepID=A0ABR2I6M1_9EUKA
MDFQSYIDKKIEVQNSILLFIDDKKDIKANFQNLTNFLNNPKLLEDQQELKEILYLISKITKNHHRDEDFFNKIEKILLLIKDPIQKIFSNIDIFQIFKNNKRILLFLLKENMLIMNESIVNLMLSTKYQKVNYISYYFPEVNGLLEPEEQAIYEEKYKNFIQKDQNNSELFEKLRHNGENESQICQLIRKDDVEEFAQYTSKEKIALTMQIEQSIFETNPLFLKKSPTLIEYSTFYGSIKITKYLFSKGVELTPSLWIYATHSRKIEMMHFLEENHVKPNVQDFMNESLKCHHFEITDHILNNLLKPLKKGEKDVFTLSVKYLNFVYFPDDLRTPTAFYYLCKYDFVNIVKSLLNQEEFEITINKEISKFNSFDRTPLQIAADEGNMRIVDLLLNNKKYAEEAFKSRAFYECKFLKQVKIPSFITSIGESCFEGCLLMEEITIPSSVTVIEENAFKRCQLITKVTIPSSVEKIGMYAFNQCISLSQVTFESPSSLKVIESFAFGLCDSLTSLIIPDSVTTIESNAFVDCRALKQLSIPSSITLLTDCFQNCMSLKKVTIPSSVEMIGNNAFSGCSSLVDVKIPSSVKIIGNNAFSECTSLVGIDIPSSVNEIGNYTFMNCSSLSNVSIPTSVSEIGEKTFANCSSLKEISIPSSVTKIGNNSFAECSSLEQLTIPASVTEIGCYAFLKCTSLKKIVIPASVKKIGVSAFYNCPSLDEISIPSSIDQDKIGIEAGVKVTKI